MWKYCNNSIPKAIIEIFKTNVSSQAALNASNNQRLYIPYCRTSIAQRSIVYKGPHIWNTCVPNNIRQSVSSTSFRNKLKSYLLQ